MNAISQGTNLHVLQFFRLSRVLRARRDRRRHVGAGVLPNSFLLLLLDEALAAEVVDPSAEHDELGRGLRGDDAAVGEVKLGHERLLLFEVLLELLHAAPVSKMRIKVSCMQRDPGDDNEPAVFVVGDHVALVLDACDAVVVLVPRREHLIAGVILLTTLLGVLRSIVPEQ